MREWWRKLKADNKGIGVVEIILILVILIAIIILFRAEIGKIVSSAMGKISTNGTNIANTEVTVTTGP